MTVNGLNFVHTLLSMTGPHTTICKRRWRKGCILQWRNLQLADFGDYDSDGECLLPLYEQYGDDFVTKLDGEFALAVVDFSNDLLSFSTDIFSINPLWFAKEGNDCEISSYESCLLRCGFDQPVQIEANSTYMYKISNFTKDWKKGCIYI